MKIGDEVIIHGFIDEIEDITSDAAISKYHYTLNFNPKMWLPYDVKYID